MVVEINRYEHGEIIEWRWASNSDLIPSPFFTSVYLVDGILIDSGAPGGTKDLKSFVEEFNGGKEIEKCVITHTHEDHAGGAYMLQNKFDIPIFASKKAVPKLRKGNTYPQYRKITWGEELLPVDAKVVQNPLISKSGKYEFNVFPMPGHAPELISLIEESQEWAFVTDAVQPKYRAIFGGKSDIQEDIKEIYFSIRKLYEFTEGMTNLKVFVSGNDVFKGRSFLGEKLKEIENLHEKVHNLYEEELEKGTEKKKILKKILKKMYGRESLTGKLTKGDLSIMNLIKSLKEWPLSK